MKSESFGCSEPVASLLERSAEVIGVRAAHVARLFEWRVNLLAVQVQKASLFNWVDGSLLSQIQTASLVKWSDKLLAVPSPSASLLNVLINLLAIPRPNTSSAEPSEEVYIVWIKRRSLPAVPSLEGQRDQKSSGGLAQPSYEIEVMRIEIGLHVWNEFIEWQLTMYHGQPFELNVGTRLKSCRPAKSEGQLSLMWIMRLSAAPSIMDSLFQWRCKVVNYPREYQPTLRTSVGVPQMAASNDRVLPGTR